MSNNTKYPNSKKQEVLFDDIRIAKLQRVETALEIYHAHISVSRPAGKMPQVMVTVNEALETVRSILAEVGG